MGIHKASLYGSVSLAALLTAATPALAAGTDSGKALYSDNCAMCHGADGKGAISGAPDFTKAGGVLAQSDSVLTKRILNGYQSKGSPMAMPAMQSRVDKAQVQQILDYMHKAFGVPASGGKQ